MVADLEKIYSLSLSQNAYERSGALSIIRDKFIFLSDKSAAWDVLHRLTNDTDSSVRKEVACVLGSVFSSVPDKSAACADLHRLTNDTDYDVIMHANHSLGKICIYKASKSENEDNSRALLEDAINYFEEAANETRFSNPAKFCSLFYRSFDAVLFRKIHSKKDIEYYIKTAKKEIRNSKSKQNLIEAIEQLAKALEIAHDAHESGGDWQETLKRCSDICNHAEQLMDENKDKTPAIHGLYKMAKPSFDETITDLIDKIKETATIAYEEAKGTPAEDVACLVKKETQRWDVTDQNQMAISLDLIIDSLKSQIPDIPDYKGIRGQIDQIKSHTEVQYQMLILSTVISQLPTISFAAKTYETVTRTENKVDSILQTVTELKDLSSKLKEEGNEKESKEVSDIADKIKALFDSGDKKDIAFFIEKIREKVPSLFEEIDKSNAPNNVKEKAKMDLKEKIMKAGKDISLGVVTNWIAAYLPSIVGAGASGLLVPAIILAALVSIDNVRDQRKK